MVEKFQFLGVDAIIASPRMRDLFQHVRKAAQSATAVLLIGESGTGKDIIARAIHHDSVRKLKPFVDLSCSALPKELVESEWSGPKRGVLSGAHPTRQSLFELAHEGSLFLNDIGALDPKLQSRLLQVLDTGICFRPGAAKQAKADIRMIAATDRPLLQAVRDGSFREDLYQRIGQITLTIPPLRERPEDIEVLANHFLAQQNPELRFASDAIMALYSYHWPGNVRELRNTIFRSSLAAKGPLLHADDIVFRLRHVQSPENHATERGIEGLEQTMIRRALEDSDGHRQRTAESLGISRTTLSRKIRSYGLNVNVQLQRRTA